MAQTVSKVLDMNLLRQQLDELVQSRRALQSRASEGDEDFFSAMTGSDQVFAVWAYQRYLGRTPEQSQFDFSEAGRPDFVKRVRFIDFLMNSPEYRLNGRARFHDGDLAFLELASPSLMKKFSRRFPHGFFGKVFRRVQRIEASFVARFFLRWMVTRLVRFSGVNGRSVKAEVADSRSIYLDMLHSRQVGVIEK